MHACMQDMTSLGFTSLTNARPHKYSLVDWSNVSKVPCLKKQQHLLNADMDVCTYNTHTHPPTHTHTCMCLCVYTHTHTMLLFSHSGGLYRGAKYTHSGCVTVKADLIE